MFGEEKKNTEEIKKAREIAEQNPDYYRLFKSHNVSEDDFETEVKLYRRDYITRAKRPKKFLKRYVNYIPEEEEIGEEYGGGSFWLVYWDSNGVEDATYLHLDESFSIAYKQKQAALNYMQPRQADPMDSIAKVIEILKPMLEMAGGGNNGQMAGINMVEKLAESFSRGLIKVQTMAVQQKLEHIKDLDKKPVPVKPDQMAWVKEVLEFAKPFIDSFLAAKGGAATWMKDTLFKNEKFKKITADSTLFSLLYTLGAKDPEIGLEKMNDLFKKAGFEVPGETPAEEETAEEETEENKTAA